MDSPTARDRRVSYRNILLDRRALPEKISIIIKKTK